MFDAALFLFIQAHHHQGRGEELRENFQRAQGFRYVPAEQQFADQNRAPTEERNGQQ